jgi:Family of unknown function (DUF6159)
MKRCEKCRALMPDDVSTCIRCGHTARAAVPVARASAPAARAPAPVARVPEAIPDLPFVKPESRAGRGWAMAVLSWRVLMAHKRLLVFPLLSAVASTLLAAGFVAIESFSKFTTDGTLLMSWYLVNSFVVIFFNSALVAAALAHFEGGKASVKDGLAMALVRLPQIAAWTLAAATVGLVLHLIEERASAVGRFVAGLLGLAWTIATYFVVPILVVEKLGPLDAVSRSIDVMRETWGEGLVGTIGMDVFLIVGLAISLGLCFYLPPLGVAALLFVWLASTAMRSILLAALYYYSQERSDPPGFEDAGFGEAFVAA